MYGGGKLTGKKTLAAGHSLQKLVNVDASIDDVIAEATVFMAVCDGSKERSNMSDVRKEVWSMKMAKPNAIKAPDRHICHELS